jgi:hypothetical protein
MSEFAFIFRGRNPNSPAEQQQQKTSQKWVAWMKELRAAGTITNPGQPLQGGGRTVSGRNHVINDGPFAEAKDVVNGFIVIQARDLDEAVEISKGCPILDADGSVEVRPVLAFSPVS